ncbi:MAG TPA: hydantoinase B/oxoprolinase family protein [Solirubrobacterales bacterium]|jgi:N-methylhydantoinase B|nr:hydantoinase B/oxoprolinase family protein [Solirubrobacterales bacterium]
MSYELNRRLAEYRPPLETDATVDAVTAGIIRGAMETTCFEVCTHVSRTATSSMINQSNERNAAIIDAHGRIAGLSIGIPQLMVVSAMPVRYALDFQDRDDWGPGDVFVANDPYRGGGHLPDYDVLAPVFDADGNLLLVQAIQVHHGDTGGKDPGGFSPDAIDVNAEGLIVPGMKLVHRGKPREDVLEMLFANNRLPSFSGDIWAQIGAAQTGARRLDELIARYGADTIRAAINWNIDHTEQRVREHVAAWPDGDYEAEVLVDHDPAGNEDLVVRCKVTVAGDSLEIDYAGTDARPELTLWNTFSNSRGYGVAQLASMIDPTIPKNEGLFNALDKLHIPDGSILNPPEGKPVVLGAFHPAVEIGEALCLALGGIVPDRAAPQVYKIGMPNVVYGFDEGGQMWLDHGVDTRCSDCSAVKGLDGWGANSASLGNLILQTAEEVEARFPVRMISREMTTDWGGPGRWRGAPGSLNVKETLEDAYGSAFMISKRHPLRGMGGGEDALPYSNHFLSGTDEEYEIELSVTNAPLPAGSLTSYQFGGGGGYGDAFERDPAMVLEDALDELVSIEGARRDYGVVLTGSVHELTLKVDAEATAALRAERPAKIESSTTAVVG